MRSARNLFAVLFVGTSLLQLAVLPQQAKAEDKLGVCVNGISRNFRDTKMGMEVCTDLLSRNNQVPIQDFVDCFNGLVPANLNDLRPVINKCTSIYAGNASGPTRPQKQTHTVKYCYSTDVERAWKNDTPCNLNVGGWEWRYREVAN